MLEKMCLGVFGGENPRMDYCILDPGVTVQLGRSPGHMESPPLVRPVVTIQ